MSETTKTPRVHAEMAARFMADGSLQCWCWNDDTKSWFLNNYPAWLDRRFYYIGHEVPTEPPKGRVIIAGIEFDAPETEAPLVGSQYWTLNPTNSLIKVQIDTWRNHPKDLERLSNGFVHTTQEAAELHREALAKLNRQLCFGDENAPR